MMDADRARRASQTRRLMEVGLMFLIVLLLAVSLAGTFARSAAASIRCATGSMSGQVEECGHEADPTAPRATARVAFPG